MSLCALQGFLFAMANAPEQLRMEEWMSVPAVEGLTDAGDLDADLAVLYEGIRSQVARRQASLPDNIHIREPALDNSLPGSDLHEWSRGFMLGHSWLQKLWQAHLPAELEGNLGTALVVLGFFGNEKLAAKFLAARADNSTGPAAMAATMLDSLPGAIAEYVNISRSIAEVLADPSLNEKPQS